MFFISCGYSIIILYFLYWLDWRQIFSSRYNMWVYKFGRQLTTADGHGEYTESSSSSLDQHGIRKEGVAEQWLRSR